MNDMNNPLELSIVATVYNDAPVVPLLVAEIIKNIHHLELNYEIILVNDFSLDDSENAIQKVCVENKNVKGISLSRNHGQQIAISAGMRFATGKYVVIMDGDLQNPPSEIPRLYSEILKGYDIVYAVSKTRNNILDKTTSRIFWYILTQMMGVKMVKNQLMMRIMKASFIDKYNKYNEINRTVESIVVDISDNYGILQVENQLRISGKSNYNFMKRANLMIDMFISLSNVPLNMMLFFGFFIFISTIIGIIYNLVQYLYYDVPAGFTSTILSIFLFGSLIILLLGFIGRYLSNIYTEVRRRPLFHVKEKYNL